MALFTFQQILSFHPFKRFRYRGIYTVIISKLSKLNRSLGMGRFGPLAHFKRANHHTSKGCYLGPSNRSTLLIFVMLSICALYFISFLAPMVVRPFRQSNHPLIKHDTDTKLPSYSVLGFPASRQKVRTSSGKLKSGMTKMGDTNLNLEFNVAFKNPNIPHHLITHNGPDIQGIDALKPYPQTSWLTGPGLLKRLLGKLRPNSGPSSSSPEPRYNGPHRDMDPGRVGEIFAPLNVDSLRDSFLPLLAMLPKYGPGRSLAGFRWLNETADVYDRCRNSVQGPFYVTDERGYFCPRTHLLPNGCCDTGNATTNFKTVSNIGWDEDNARGDALGETYIPEYDGGVDIGLSLTPPNVYEADYMAATEMIRATDEIKGTVRDTANGSRSVHDHLSRKINLDSLNRSDTTDTNVGDYGVSVSPPPVTTGNDRTIGKGRASTIVMGRGVYKVTDVGVTQILSDRVELKDTAPALVPTSVRRHQNSTADQITATNSGGGNGDIVIRRNDSVNDISPDTNTSHVTQPNQTSSLPGSDKAVPAVERFVCTTCGPDACCTVYEHCVSCCMHPAKRATIESALARWGRGRDRTLTAVTDHFEACLARCRTSSASVQHENAYRNPRAKHCFGTVMPSLDLIEAIVPNRV